MSEVRRLTGRKPQGFATPSSYYFEAHLSVSKTRQTSQDFKTLETNYVGVSETVNMIENVRQVIRKTS